ncbi:MAG: hypothetical protein LBH44_01580 [Treponema sp.]|nr:hypothetical protein [Treponema sp.]
MKKRFRNSFFLLLLTIGCPPNDTTDDRIDLETELRIYIWEIQQEIRQLMFLTDEQESEIITMAKVTTNEYLWVFKLCIDKIIMNLKTFL